MYFCIFCSYLMSDKCYEMTNVSWQATTWQVNLQSKCFHSIGVGFIFVLSLTMCLTSVKEKQCLRLPGCRKMMLKHVSVNMMTSRLLKGGTDRPALQRLWRTEVVLHALPLFLLFSTKEQHPELSHLQPLGRRWKALENNILEKLHLRGSFN